MENKERRKRKEIHFVLDVKKIEALRKYSAETMIPMSRLIDQAIDLLREKRKF